MEALRSTLSVLNSGRKIVQASFVAYSIYSLYDQGVADLLGLKTLRHGTCLRNWTLIQFQGADPDKGARAPGEYKVSPENGRRQCRNAFFVCRDSTGVRQYLRERGSLFDKIRRVPWTRFIPRDYAVLSSSAWLKGDARRMSNGFWVLGLITGFFVPTLKFRFHPTDEELRFTYDREMGRGLAQFTNDPISPFHLGISGSLIQAVRHPNIFKRYWDSPAKPLFGALELYAALLLTSRYWSTIERAAGACKLGNVAAKAPEQLVNLWSNTSRWIKWPVAVTTWFTSW